MTFVEVLYFIDEQIRSLNFLIATANLPEVKEAMKTSQKSLILLKEMLIEEANKRQGVA
jgi:hypothetical protein